jgi:DNA-binding response OmpR family regulator
VARILIVEDDPSVSRLLDLSLAVEGFETEPVRTGGAALERLDHDPVDLVVLDIMLPEVGGFELLEELRSRVSWDDTKVIVLTALDSDEDVWRGWSSGADYYLTKPFDHVHLRTVVERLLAGDDLGRAAAAGERVT